MSALKSPAQVVDPEARTVLQNVRDVINPMLSGSDLDKRIVTQQQLLNSGLWVKDGRGGIRSIVSGGASPSGGTEFTKWLENGFLKSQFSTATFVIGAEVGNTINVSVQLRNGIGNNLVGIHSLTGYFSDASTGAVFSATVPSGGVAAGAAGDVEIIGTTTYQFISDSTSAFDIDITHVGVFTFYLVLIDSANEIVVSNAIAFA